MRLWFVISAIIPSLKSDTLFDLVAASKILLPSVRLLPGRLRALATLRVTSSTNASSIAQQLTW